MKPGADLPSIADMPIPLDVKPGPGWSAQMREMAEHIGGYATLLISENFGGQEIYVAADPERNAFRDVVGPEKASILSQVYGRERIIVPLGRNALHAARRGPVIAAARAGELTIGEAAHILNMRRDYTSKLVNSTAELTHNAQPLSLGRRKVDPRQIDMFAQDE